VHAIVVMTPGDGARRPWGVVTDRELIRRAARIAELTAGEASVRRVLEVQPGDELAKVGARLLVRGLSHALVVAPATGCPIGVLSTWDVVGALAWAS
jgi:CBS-domain-containing membrane protein